MSVHHWVGVFALSKSGSALIGKFKRIRGWVILFACLTGIFHAPIVKGAFGEVDLDTYGTLSNAVSIIGTNNAAIRVNSPTSITGSLTVPSNISIRVINGGMFAISPSCTLTFNGGFVSDIRKIFDFPGVGTGKVQFGANSIVDVFPQWWGAKADGVNDDTGAIYRAIDSIPHDYTHKGGARLLFPIPEVDKFYKISSTIDFTEIWNTTIECPTRFGFNRNGSLSLFKWYGAANTSAFLFDYSIGITVKNISLDGRGTAGLVGFSFGRTATQNSSVKMLHVEGMSVYNCDIGVRVGDVSDNGPDVAHISFINTYLQGNTSIGFMVRSGNAVVECYTLVSVLNGTTPAGGLKGCNMFISGGSLSLYGYTSGGSPYDADIYQENGGINIYGAWSDSRGVFLSGGYGTETAFLSGVRHYEAGMTPANTPYSITWNGPQPLVLTSCRLYNSVGGFSGYSGHIVDVGTRFIAPGATFTGDMVSLYNGYIGIGGVFADGSNEARVSVGKPARSDGGVFKPLTVFSGSLQGGLTRSADNYVVQEMLNSSDSSMYSMFNMYYDGVFRSTGAGRVGLLQVKPGQSDAMLRLLVDSDATAANQSKSPTTNVFTVANFNGGFYTMQLQNQSIGWRTGAPTSGTWSRGDVIWNKNVGAGVTTGWMCTVSGSPGTWRAMANLP